MRYVRIFHIQAAHFNGRDAYDQLAAACEAEREGDFEAACSSYRAALVDIHGHNFRIVVEAASEQLDAEGYLIDDEWVERVVKEWDNKNLSMLHGFRDNELRATTENMARVLARKLGAIFAVNLKVTVHETDNIYAVAGQRAAREQQA